MVKKPLQLLPKQMAQTVRCQLCEYNLRHCIDLGAANSWMIQLMHHFCNMVSMVIVGNLLGVATTS